MSILDNSFQEMAHRCQHLMKHTPSSLMMKSNQFRLRDQEDENRRLEALVDCYRREGSRLHSGSPALVRTNNPNPLERNTSQRSFEASNLWESGVSAIQNAHREPSLYAAKEPHNNYFALPSSHLEFTASVGTRNATGNTFPLSENIYSVYPTGSPMNSRSADRNRLDVNVDGKMRVLLPPVEAVSDSNVTRSGMTSSNYSGHAKSRHVSHVLQSPTQLRPKPQHEQHNKLTNVLYNSSENNRINSKRYSPSRDQVREKEITQRAIFRNRNFLSPSIDFEQSNFPYTCIYNPLSPPPGNPCSSLDRNSSANRAMGQEAFLRLSRSLSNQSYNTAHVNVSLQPRVFTSQGRKEVWENENNVHRSMSLLSPSSITEDPFEVTERRPFEYSSTHQSENLRSQVNSFDINSFVKAEPLKRPKDISSHSADHDTRGVHHRGEEIVVGGVNRFLRYRNSDSRAAQGEKDHNRRKRRRHHHTQKNTEDKTCQTIDIHIGKKRRDNNTCSSPSSPSSSIDGEMQVQVTVEPNKSMYDEYYDPLKCYEESLSDITKKEDNTNKNNKCCSMENCVNVNDDHSGKASDDMESNVRAEKSKEVSNKEVTKDDEAKVSPTKQCGRTSDNGICTSIRSPSRQSDISLSSQTKRGVSVRSSSRSMMITCPRSNDGSEIFMSQETEQQLSGPTEQQIDIASKLWQDACLSRQNISQRSQEENPQSKDQKSEKTTTKVIPHTEFKQLLLADWNGNRDLNVQLSSGGDIFGPLSQRLHDRVLTERDFPPPPNMKRTPISDKTKPRRFCG
eukprot:Tbor_TRINITY_DN8417_c0_g1::TRINITY_DN8417_c0_g1_i1::g.5306::m.5306